MRFIAILSAAILAPMTALAAPAGEPSSEIAAGDEWMYKRQQNLCSLKAPPVLCQPNSSVTVEETAERAYRFYRAFVVDGNATAMFSLIDNVYKVSHLLLSSLCFGLRRSLSEKC